MTTELVDVDGTRLRVSIEGSGRPLLLFNGIGASLEMFEPLREHLRATETIAVDMPGTGSSAPTAIPLRMCGLARLADALLARLGYREVDVLGVSWGGALAQEFALRHGDRVRRLVLAATGPGWLGVPGHPRGLRVLATLLRQQGDLRFLAPRSLRGYLYQLAAIWGWSSLFRLHRVAAPTLVLAADDDPIIPLVNARLIARRVRDARLHVVSRGGHLFLITHAATVAPIVESFLAAAGAR